MPVYLNLFEYKNGVCKSLGMQDFSNKTFCYKLGQLGSDCLPLILSEMMQLLSNQLYLRVDIQFVLHKFPGKAGHVRRLPSEHVPVVLLEPNEHAFLFDIEAGAYGRRLVRFEEAETSLLGFFSRSNRGS
jgi:hypothetical protein